MFCFKVTTEIPLALFLYARYREFLAVIFVILVIWKRLILRTWNKGTAIGLKSH